MYCGHLTHVGVFDLGGSDLSGSPVWKPTPPPPPCSPWPMWFSPKWVGRGGRGGTWRHHSGVSVFTQGSNRLINGPRHLRGTAFCRRPRGRPALGLDWGLGPLTSPAHWRGFPPSPRSSHSSRWPRIKNPKKRSAKTPQKACEDVKQLRFCLVPLLFFCVLILRSIFVKLIFWGAFLTIKLKKVVLEMT